MTEKLKQGKENINELHHPIILQAKYVEGEPGSEEDRGPIAKFYKLKSDATWNDIWNAVWDTDRKFHARRFGLPESTSWDDLEPHLTRELVRRGAFDKILEIPPHATPEQRDEMAKYLSENIQGSKSE